MTIKKPMKTTAAEPVADLGTASATPAATIADRFKLDAPDPSAQKRSSGGPAAMAALIAGLVALGIAGFLTFVIYQHWVFLQAA